LCRNINIGKFGSFPANLLLGRPFYLTFEVLENDSDKSKTELRVVPASELHAEALGEHSTSTESRDDANANDGGVEFDIVGEDGEIIMRSNRLTIDDPSRQTLSMEEIEELKKAGTGSGKDIIAKIMASHMAIDQKTTFSLAKYTLRKSRKYLKRFTVLPVDIGLLTEYITDKEAYKIMELREESIGLLNSWANVHCGSPSRVLFAEDGISQIGGGRWLVVDDTGGLVVAAMADRMGILSPHGEEEEAEDEEDQLQPDNAVEVPQEDDGNEKLDENDTGHEEIPLQSEDKEAEDVASKDTPAASTTSDPAQRPRRPPHQHIPQSTSQTNSITVLHSNNQPNLSVLKYFSFDSSNPIPKHPLYHHLRTISWLQLISPQDDPTYQEPETVDDNTLAAMKSSKRGNYYKKRRRWERTAMIVDETRRGGFDGLVVCSVMEPASILNACVPLVCGGGRVVVYSPNAEPLVELCDFYSKDRRAAYVSRQTSSSAKTNGRVKGHIKVEESEMQELVENDDAGDENFPVNPTLLLAPSLQTARARQWQVLPGRTHPMMTSKGGAEGYIFTGTRVLPIEGKVEARGSYRSKKRKTGTESAVSA
jgi:tRNA (adenine58-N1)-methyltransferase non-catalytic subunit